MKKIAPIFLSILAFTILFAGIISHETYAAQQAEKGNAISAFLNFFSNLFKSNEKVSPFAIFGKEPATQKFTLSVSVTGSGTVVSSDRAIDCDPECKAQYVSGRTATLEAHAFAGSTFTEWTGTCTSTSPTCIISMNSNKAVTATFSKAEVTITDFTISPANPVQGTDTTITFKVSSSAANIAGATFYIDGTTVVKQCTNPTINGKIDKKKYDCTYTQKFNAGTYNYYITASDDAGNDARYPATGTNSFTVAQTTPPLTVTVKHLPAKTPTAGQPVTINAKAKGDSRHKIRQIDIYLGDLTTPAKTCTVPASARAAARRWSCVYKISSWPSTGAPATYTAVVIDKNGDKFTDGPKNFVFYTLKVTKTGAGSGFVTSNPAGINYPVIYSANFASKTQVTLTAAPAINSDFGGWDGACKGTATTCTVTVDSDKTVTASFLPI